MDTAKPYATMSSMVARFGQEELIALAPLDTKQDDALAATAPHDANAPPSATPSATPARINADAINAALKDGTAVVNAYIASRHKLPLKEPPSILERIVCDIARYTLYDHSAPAQVKERYMQAIFACKDIAYGRITLTQNQGAPAQSISTISYKNPPRVFTNQKLRNL